MSRESAKDLFEAVQLGEWRARLIAAVSKVVADLRLDDVIGRAIVVHQGRDDLESQPSGGAGDPVAAGVIGIAAGESSGGESRLTGTGRTAG